MRWVSRVRNISRPSFLVMVVLLSITLAMVPSGSALAIPSPELVVGSFVSLSQLLALASEKGRITVALRNPDDQRTAERLPDINSNALFDSVQRDTIKGIRRPGGPTRIPEGPSFPGGANPFPGGANP